MRAVLDDASRSCRVFGEEERRRARRHRLARRPARRHRQLRARLRGGRRLGRARRRRRAGRRRRARAAARRTSTRRAAGGGAFRDDAPIRVSTRAPEQAIVATGFPFRHKELPRRVRARCSSARSLAFEDLRRAGAASLDLRWTAEGVFDGYFELRLGPWDVAAGALIVREAGRRRHRLGRRRRAWLTSGDIVAAPPAVHARLLELIPRLTADAERRLRRCDRIAQRATSSPSAVYTASVTSSTRCSAAIGFGKPVARRTPTTNPHSGSANPRDDAMPPWPNTRRVRAAAELDGDAEPPRRREAEHHVAQVVAVHRAHHLDGARLERAGDRTRATTRRSARVRAPGPASTRPAPTLATCQGSLCSSSIRYGTIRRTRRRPRPTGKRCPFHATGTRRSPSSRLPFGGRRPTTTPRRRAAPGSRRARRSRSGRPSTASTTAPRTFQPVTGW